ncbi:hypothetical protein EJB05_30796, partial [Eragrostis curvula]
MGETQPLNNTSAYHGQVNPQDAVLRRVLAGMAKPVYLLDITYMSQLRKDGHTTKYNGNSDGADCTHWCVAGVPDTWNIVLYAVLIGQQLPVCVEAKMTLAVQHEGPKLPQFVRAHQVNSNLGVLRIHGTDDKYNRCNDDVSRVRAVAQPQQLQSTQLSGDILH